MDELSDNSRDWDFVEPPREFPIVIRRSIWQKLVGFWVMVLGPMIFGCLGIVIWWRATRSLRITFEEHRHWIGNLSLILLLATFIASLFLWVRFFRVRGGRAIHLWPDRMERLTWPRRHVVPYREIAKIHHFIESTDYLLKAIITDANGRTMFLSGVQWPVHEVLSGLDELAHPKMLERANDELKAGRVLEFPEPHLRAVLHAAALAVALVCAVVGFALTFYKMTSGQDWEPKNMILYVVLFFAAPYFLRWYRVSRRSGVTLSATGLCLLNSADSEMRWKDIILAVQQEHGVTLDAERSSGPIRISDCIANYGVLTSLISERLPESTEWNHEDE